MQDVSSLTEAETQLLSFFENKTKERKRIDDDKIAERLLLSETLHKSSLAVIARKKEEPPFMSRGDTEKTEDDTSKCIDGMIIHGETHEEVVSANSNNNINRDSRFTVSNDNKLLSISSSDIDRLFNSSPLVPPLSIPLVLTEETTTALGLADAIVQPITDVTDLSSNQGYQRIKKRRRALDGNTVDDNSEHLEVSVSTTDAKQLLIEPANKPRVLHLAAGTTLSETDWDPRATSDYVSREFVLDNFSYQTNQTLVLKVTVPSSSRRWSLNICPFEYRDECDILFHFNPRYLGSKKSAVPDVILNDKQGTWGMGMKSSLSGGDADATAILTDSVSGIGKGACNVELMVQIRKPGFCVFVNGRFGFYFPHRRDPTQYSRLRLTLPSKDDTGKAEEVIFHKVWWGNRQEAFIPLPSMLAVLQRSKSCTYDPSTAAVTGFPPSYFQRSVDLRGLPPVSDPVEVYELECALKQLFSEHTAEATSIVPGKGRGFVRLESTEKVAEAIKELNGSEFQEDSGQRCILVLSRPPDIL